MQGSHPCPSLTKVKILGNTLEGADRLKSRVFLYENLDRTTFVALRSTGEIRDGEAELQLESKCTPARPLVGEIAY